ncbi:MAG: enoyl-CoA hydratase/isomerase family protein, partial [Candidatus Lokiarchaeota archaeon]|nr:enoyl-CoA hydratase/isomerase family protein [Candidatus Lokiarchaeota archaeon]
MTEPIKFEHVKIEKVEEDNYAVVSIIRPDKLNALQNQTLYEISKALESVEVDQSVRCVVIRGTKEFTKKRAFSAGADLSSRGDRGPTLDHNNIRHRGHAMHLRHKYYDSIEAFPKPLIAAVDGYALGGGLELVLVCDIVIASKRSQFGFPEIKRGIFPGNGGTQRMIRHLGKMRVNRMTYFGEHFTAEQMDEWGFISFLVDDDKFEDFVKEKASWLGNAATNALYVIKKCIQYGSQVPLNVGLQFEYWGYALNTTSKDAFEGVRAFNEKR